MHKRNTNRGFSLIELLVVVAIILIIAAIAIPNLLKAKGSANAASAVASLRAVNSANQLYSNTYNAFAPTLAALGPPAPAAAASAASANLLDGVISGCMPAAAPCVTDVASKSGYNFTYTAGAAPAAAYIIIGLPAAGTPAGLSGYCTDASGAILADPAGTYAGATVAAGCGGDAGASPI